jgi:acyl carrier protein
MGMDTVELAMDIEDLFDIEISDASAGAIHTVGDLQAFVLSALAHKGTPQNPDDVFERIKRLLIDSFGVPEKRINPEARIVDDLGLD